MGITPIVFVIVFVLATSLVAFVLPRVGRRFFGRTGALLFGLLPVVGVILLVAVGYLTISTGKLEPTSASLLFGSLFAPAIFVLLASTISSYRREMQPQK